MKAMNVSEVADKVGICRASIYRAIARDEFPAPAKVTPRRSVWDEAEIDTWLQARFDARPVKRGAAA